MTSNLKKRFTLVCMISVGLLLVVVSIRQLDDPQQPQAPIASNDWEAEKFNEQAGEQLHQLGDLIARPRDISAAKLATLLTGDFSCSNLRPSPQQTQLVFEDDAVRIERGIVGGLFHGQAGFVKTLTDLAEPFASTSKVRVKFKLFRVERHGDIITTQQYVSIFGLSTAASNSMEENATWTCQWQQPDPAASPKLISIAVDDYERATWQGPRATMFLDCTEAAIGHNEVFNRVLRQGHWHWMSRIEAALSPGITALTGMAVGDVNGDRLDDLFLCQPGGIPNQLYIQNKDGTLTDRSHEAGLDWMETTLSALIIDIDNDGDQDMVAATDLTLSIWLNNGQAVFTPGTQIRLFQLPTSLAAVDYDNDGDLDIYLCGYQSALRDNNRSSAGQIAVPIPFHDANNGVANVLLRNDGGGRFTDVTAPVGLQQNNRRFSYAAAWEDYDNDGDLDLYVANDFGRNNLYRNDAGHFTDVAAQAGVEDIATGMSVSFGDYDHDGLMDLYVSNMFSSAGNRVTYQRRFKPNADETYRQIIQRTVRGNSLFHNAGDGTFDDVSVQAGVTMGRWAWGSGFVDLNNDSFEDLVVCNGFVTNGGERDL